MLIKREHVIREVRCLNGDIDFLISYQNRFNRFFFSVITDKSGLIDILLHSYFSIDEEKFVINKKHYETV